MPLFTSEVSIDNTPLPVNVSNATLAVTQSGSWTVSLAAGSIDIGKVDQGIAAPLSGAWPVEITDGTNVLGTAAHPLVDNISQIGGSAIALGQTTMSASLPVTIASNQSALPVTLTSTTITGTVAVTQSTSPWVVSGTVTANIGTTNGLALDATVSGLQVAQGSTTSGQKGDLILGAVTTAAPTYTTAQSNPLSLLTTGALRTDNSSWLGSTAPTVGSKTSANSIPVVIASDQSSVPVTPAAASTATVTRVAVTTASTTLLASRAARLNAVIFNENGTLFVLAGAGTASSTNYTWRLTANTELDVTTYTGALTAVASAGTSNVQVTDF